MIFCEVCYYDFCEEIEELVSSFLGSVVIEAMNMSCMSND